MSKTWRRLQEQLEFAFPLTIAIVAAVLAINDLFGGKYASDEIKLTNDRNSSYQWYQSKGIKETILEGQSDLLKTLIKSGSIVPEQRQAIEESLAQTEQKLRRYKKEKHEILLGSRALPREEWVQDIDGQFGKVVGAKEYESFILRLGDAGDFFDLATMLFQLSLVIGAVGIMMRRDSLRWAFFRLMLSGTLVGLTLSGLAIWMASQVSVA